MRGPPATCSTTTTRLPSSSATSHLPPTGSGGCGRGGTSAPSSDCRDAAAHPATASMWSRQVAMAVLVARGASWCGQWPAPSSSRYMTGGAPAALSVCTARCPHMGTTQGSWRPYTSATGQPARASISSNSSSLRGASTMLANASSAPGCSVASMMRDTSAASPSTAGLCAYTRPSMLATVSRLRSRSHHSTSMVRRRPCGTGTVPSRPSSPHTPCGRDAGGLKDQKGVELMSTRPRTLPPYVAARLVATYPPRLLPATYAGARITSRTNSAIWRVHVSML
mmetsp:Transcript_9885/g.24700  ORF Transcript_9885/g.24700 Transcript_9885/m.24700 type:complete len:281 (-) Transcript_9885:610-1452(-)